MIKPFSLFWRKYILYFLAMTSCQVVKRKSRRLRNFRTRKVLFRPRYPTIHFLSIFWYISAVITSSVGLRFLMKYWEHASVAFRCENKSGKWNNVQCLDAFGLCWCVDKHGVQLPGTMVRGRPICSTRTFLFHPFSAGRLLFHCI